MWLREFGEVPAGLAEMGALVVLVLVSGLTGVIQLMRWWRR